MRVAGQDNDISPISRGPIGRKLLVQITEDMQTHILLDDCGASDYAVGAVAV
jgi:poly-beta-hydroxyalkanoate depolymerase